MIQIHKLADVQSLNIGEETRVWQFVVILEGAQIGKNCNICAHTYIENDVVIGDNVTVKCGVFIWDGITIENNVQLGPNVTFTNDLYPRAKQPFKLLKTKVEHGASIGANATIIGGITIGENSMIGAGAVVTKNVPNNTLWLGNPARQISFICNCGHKLNENFSCVTCGLRYKQFNNQIILDKR